MEAVAARAHTGKQVLYRLWRNRTELVVAAMRHRTGSIVTRGEIPTADVPDRRDLTAPTYLLRHEMLFTREPVAARTLTSLVDDVFLPLVTGKQ